MKRMNKKEGGVRIALLQISPLSSLEENLDKGIAACRKAKEGGADIALFPEMWSNGYSIIDRPSQEWREDAVSAHSSFIRSFKALAKELEMAIAITFLERHSPLPLNSMLLFDRKGEQKLSYSKVHTCDFGAESGLSSGGGFHVCQLDTDSDSLNVGAMICYDREFPESARILMLEGAELILVPNACPMEINRLSQLRSRAFENMVAIATCNYPESVVDCNGRSSLFDGIAWLPDSPSSRDCCVLLADSGEGIYFADLDLKMLRAYRKSEVFGNAYRHPQKYHMLIDEKVMEPFIREDSRRN